VGGINKVAEIEIFVEEVEQMEKQKDFCVKSFQLQFCIYHAVHAMQMQM
jgi:hypothetical protein